MNLLESITSRMTPAAKAKFAALAAKIRPGEYERLQADVRALCASDTTEGAKLADRSIKNAAQRLGVDLSPVQVAAVRLHLLSPESEAT